jgi:uncharacterized membrane protein
MKKMWGWQQTVGVLLTVVAVAVGVVIRLGDPSMTNWEFVVQYPVVFTGEVVMLGTGMFLMTRGNK